MSNSTILATLLNSFSYPNLIGGETEALNIKSLPPQNMYSLLVLKSKVQTNKQTKLWFWRPGSSKNHWFVDYQEVIYLLQPQFPHLEDGYNQLLPSLHICCGHQLQLWLWKHFIMIKEYSNFLGNPHLVHSLLLLQFLVHWHSRGPVKTSWMNGQINSYCFHWAKVCQSRSFLNNSPKSQQSCGPQNKSLKGWSHYLSQVYLWFQKENDPEFQER